MHHGDRFTLVFNGEIYNARELRGELEAGGATFQTKTDTEVLLAAFAAWGEACLLRLRGMFAFALADWEKQRLVLARDPLGIKPLVYFHHGGVFAFASEINALRCIPVVRAANELDPVALDSFLRLLYISAPRTIYRHIRKLPPAHFLSLDLRDGAVKMDRYWSLQYAPDEGRSSAEWQEAADEAIARSVVTHLASDVPVGVLLSGGVDSTLMAMEAQRAGGALRTFTIGFPGASANDEREIARTVATDLSAEHFETIMPPGVGDLLERAVQHCGEPFGDSSLLCAWELCRFAKQHVGVVLSGDGGDELFAGYPLYREWLRRAAWSSGPHPLWKRMLQPFLHTIRPLRWPNLNPEVAGAGLWTECVEHMPTQMRRSLWRRELWDDAFAGAPQEISDSFGKTRSLTPLTRAQACDLAVYLPGDILPKMDTASMAHGLEARTPLVDVRLAEFAATIPASELTSGDPGDARSWRGKRLLKHRVAQRFPHAFTERRKQGFTAPLQQWLSYDKAGRERLRHALESADSPLRQWFEPAALARIGTSANDHHRWQMLFLSVWAESAAR